MPASTVKPTPRQRSSRESALGDERRRTAASGVGAFTRAPASGACARRGARRATLITNVIEEQQRPEEEERGVVRAADHDLAHLGGDGGRERAHRVEHAPEIMAALPEAMSTIIVSPTARASPSRTPADDAGRGRGQRDVHAVCQREAPRASEASR